MIKKALVLAASVAVMAIAGGAGAADFSFSFTGTGTGPELVTGDIYGLADSGSSQPTSVSVQYGGQTYNFNPTQDEQETMSGTFNVTGNVVSTAFYIDDVSQSNGLDAYYLQLNGGGTYFSNEGGYTTANSPVIFTPLAAPPSPISDAPEPTTWLLMLAGVGAMGLMLRRRRSIGTLAAA